MAVSVLVSCLWLGQGLVHSARQRPFEGKAYDLLDGVAERDRYQATLNIFWYNKLFYGAIYAWVLAIAIPEIVTARSSPGPDQVDLDWKLTLTLFLGGLVVRAQTRLLEKRHAGVETLVKILEIFTGEKDDRRPSVTPRDPRDPLQGQRLTIAEAAILMRRTARHVERRMPRNAAPHPVSSLLRASALQLERFVTSQRSLSPELPYDVREILALTARLLISSTATPYQSRPPGGRV